MSDRFNSLNAWLKRRYGEKVYKVSLHAGFTCPNRDGAKARGGCTFCSIEALEPFGYQRRQTIGEQLGAGMEYIRERHGAHKFIAYYQDYTTTYGTAEALREIYRPPLEEESVVGLALATRPDCLGADVLDLLDEMHARKDLWIELGLQIADDSILDAVNRAHTVDDFVRATRALQSRGIPVCAHVIIGLPGATRDTEIRTARLLADLGVWGVKLHALHVMKNTPLADQYAAGDFEVMTLDEHVERVVDFIEHLPETTLIHRVTGEAPRRLTIAPDWTVNKLAVYNAVVNGFRDRDTRQGARHHRALALAR